MSGCSHKPGFVQLRAELRALGNILATHRQPLYQRRRTLGVFGSYGSDLVPEDGNGFYDVFVRDLVAGTTERDTVNADGSNPSRRSCHLAGTDSLNLGMRTTGT